jgi:hypothetical protein
VEDLDVLLIPYPHLFITIPTPLPNHTLLPVSAGLRIIIGCAGNFTSQLLKSLPLRLGDQQRSEDAQEHEQRENLHHVVQPRAGVLLRDNALRPQRTKDGLGHNRTDFAGGGAETVRCRAVARREALAGDDESRSVGAEVEEELAEDVKSQESVLAKLVVREADDAEEDGEDGEAHELDGLAADGVDGCDGDPVAGDGTSADDDQIAYGGVAEDVVDVGAAGVADGRQDDGVVQAETVERNVTGMY